MSNGLYKAEELFKTLFPVIERVDLCEKGLKLLRLSGGILEFITYHTLCALKDAFEDQDVCIVDYNEHVLHFHPDLNGNFRDEYTIILSSKAWLKVPLGGLIPEIKALFTKEEDGISCRIVDVVDVSSRAQAEKLHTHLTNLITTILDPKVLSSSVIQLAQSIRDQIN